MQGRAGGHLPSRASILPADVPAKDPAASSPLECEAARILLQPMLSKAGPGGAGVAGSLLLHFLASMLILSMWRSQFYAHEISAGL